MDFERCPECRQSTEVVLDCRTGDTICSQCGLVLDSHYVDETSEWRTFGDDNSDDKDPSRVGSRADSLLTSHTNLSVVISNPKHHASMESLPLSRSKLQSRELNQDKTLVTGFEGIASMADGLGIPAAVKVRAKEIFKNAEDKKLSRGRNVNAILGACLFIACREARLSRTLKEISTVATGASMKEINRASSLIKSQLEVDTGTVNAGELVRRFCSSLGMSSREIKAVQEGLHKSQELDIRRTPNSILAAIIYMITQLSAAKKSLRDIAMAADVAEGTIKKSYRDLHQYASRIIPHWYAVEENINKLCPP